MFQIGHYALMTVEPPADCVAALRGLAHSWPPATEMLIVEVHPHGGTNRFMWDLVACPMTKDGTRADGVAEAVTTGLFLHDSTPSDVAMIVGRWWKLAGADQLSVPAYVAPHDSWQSFDVRRQRWIEDSELYS